MVRCYHFALYGNIKFPQGLPGRAIYGHKIVDYGV